MKLYAIMWGYYSSLEGTGEWESIWTSEELAQKALNKIVEERKLEPSKKNEGVYTDGDYYTYISTVFADSETLYCPPEEV